MNRSSKTFEFQISVIGGPDVGSQTVKYLGLLVHRSDHQVSRMDLSEHISSRTPEIKPTTFSELISQKNLASPESDIQFISWTPITEFKTKEMMMVKNTDFDAWDDEFGPRSKQEAEALTAVVGGATRVGCYTGEPSHNGKAWLVSREGQRRLRLQGSGPRQGFRKFVWLYTIGKREWRRAPRTLEHLFEDA